MRTMSDDDGLAVLGAVGAIVIGIVVGMPWVWIPASVLLVVETLCLLPAYPGGGVPIYRDEQDALDEIADTLRRIERSQSSD